MGSDIYTTVWRGQKVDFLFQTCHWLIMGTPNSRVTIWGQSAGSGSTMIHVSVEVCVGIQLDNISHFPCFQLTANGGKNQNLFRAAMGDSPPLTYMPLFDQPYAEEIFIQFANLACADGVWIYVCSLLKSFFVVVAPTQVPHFHACARPAVKKSPSLAANCWLLDPRRYTSSLQF